MSGDTTRLPRMASEVTADWLRGALSARHPGIVLESVQLIDVTATTATKLRLQFNFSDTGKAALPETMILKGGLAGLPHEVELWLLYRNEAIFYRDIAPHLDIDLPRCFFADTDGETGLVLFEDLTRRNVRFGAGARPFAPDLVATALEYQASYHAKWWGSDADALGKLMSFETFFDWFWKQPWLVNVGSQTRTPSPRGASLLTQARSVVSDLERFKRAVLAAHRENLLSPQCLLHADPHPGNMYFDSAGAPRWLDWQLATRGCWAWDVAYFMIGAMTVADRRANEKALLRHYLSHLRTQGVESPDWETAWQAYRRNAIWGISWALVPEQMQSAENGNPIIERFATAIGDLATFECLGMPAESFDFNAAPSVAGA